MDVIAIAQEDKDLASHAKFLKHFEPDGPRFEIVADLEGKATTGPLHRTSTYLVDPEGVVRQVFPSTIHHRPPWEAVWREVDRLMLADDP